MTKNEPEIVYEMFGNVNSLTNAFGDYNFLLSVVCCDMNLTTERMHCFNFDVLFSPR